MEFVDRILKCTDCGGEFIFTAGEQLFFFDKNFKNDPKRCKPCKAKHLNADQSAGASTRPGVASRIETRTLCSQCGIETSVPFKPTQGRPVLCRQCFQASRAPSSCEGARKLDPISTTLLAADTATVINDLASLPAGLA